MYQDCTTQSPNMLAETTAQLISSQGEVRPSIQTISFTGLGAKVQSSIQILAFHEMNSYTNESMFFTFGIGLEYNVILLVIACLLYGVVTDTIIKVLLGLWILRCVVGIILLLFFVAKVIKIPEPTTAPNVPGQTAGPTAPTQTPSTTQTIDNVAKSNVGLATGVLVGIAARSSYRWEGSSSNISDQLSLVVLREGGKLQFIAEPTTGPDILTVKKINSTTLIVYAKGVIDYWCATYFGGTSYTYGVAQSVNQITPNKCKGLSPNSFLNASTLNP